MNGLEDAGSVDTLAAEYVIGTLAGDERTVFTGRLATDEAARGAVAAWERRLSPLRLAGEAVPPPADLWPRLEKAIGAPSVQRFSVIDGGALPSAAIRRSRDRWRVSALALAGIAAVLVVFVAVREFADIGPPAAGTYVAAVNRGGDKPALIVTVDLETRQVLIRPIAAQAPPGHSLELWYIGDGHAPRSMGLVTDAAAHVAIPTDSGADRGGAFAVSVEPPGGSKTGGPSGAVLYSGQLVKQ